MKKIDIILNAFRFSPKQVGSLLAIIGLIGLSWLVEDSIVAYEPLNKDLKKIISQKQSENEQYKYVEDILAEHYDNLEKYKSIKSPDLFGLQEEIEGLIPRGISIEETKLDGEEFMIRGLSPNLRTVDFLVSILNTYNDYYGGFKGEIVLESVNKKDTMQNFRIKGEIDSEKIVNKIYSNDIDGDGVVDSIVEEVISTSGVKQKRSIVNDYCPFTPSFNIVIGKLIESNPTLVQSYPYYDENYKKGFFDFNYDTGCLRSGDTELEFKNEE